MAGHLQSSLRSNSFSLTSHNKFSADTSSIHKFGVGAFAHFSSRSNNNWAAISSYEYKYANMSKRKMYKIDFHHVQMNVQIYIPVGRYYKSYHFLCLEPGAMFFASSHVPWLQEQMRINEFWEKIKALSTRFPFLKVTIR